jgi:hypothetical protein
VQEGVLKQQDYILVVLILLLPVVTTATEKYDGTSWASANNMNTKRQLLSGCGTQTAGLAFGGLEPTPFTVLAATEEYNGATWANSNNMVSASRNAAGAGIQTAALAFGGTSDGANPLSPTLTQEYNGSSWTTTPGSLNTGRVILEDLEHKQQH